MDFSKLKLVTEMLAQGTGTSLTTTANQKSTQQSQGGKQMSNTSNNIGMQQAQMAQKPKGTGPTMDSKIQKNVAAPNPSPNATAAQAIVSGDDYFDALRARKEFYRKLNETRHDWRKDLQEALGKDDEVFHPYVEVMPMKDFKQQEAKKNLKRQALEPGSADNPAQKMVKGQMIGMGEEVQLDEAKKSTKADKVKKSKKGDDDKKSKKKPKILPDEKTPNYIKNKTTLAKISSRMKKSRTEARRHSRAARDYFSKQTQAMKKGDEKSRKHYSQKGAEAQAKAKKAKSESDSYIPYGSSTYSKAGKPSEMNQKYFRDRETEAGRRRIALRSLGQ